jgi:enoyl-CoA hydratase/carnithine racemase
MSELIVEKTAGVLAVAMNRPEALNAFNPPLLRKLTAAVRAASSDPDVGVIILFGGAFDGEASEAASAIRRCLKPVIAKVHGACFTGALELALHCDFIFTTVDTKFGDTHAKWGLRPTWGMSQNLARAIGVRRARELSFTARTFTGADAARWGLANEALADKAALDAHVAARAAEIASGSRGAISAYKKLYSLHEEYRPLEEALATEVELEFPEIDDTGERLKGFGR